MDCRDRLRGALFELRTFLDTFDKNGGVVSFHNCEGYHPRKAKFGDITRCICGKRYIFKKKWWMFGHWIPLNKRSSYDS